MRVAFHRFQLWAHVVGRCSSAGSYGHLGAYARELTVEAVLEVAPASSPQAEACRDAGAP